MTFQQFEELQESIFNEIRSMASSKGREYANGEDRFLNFKEIGSSLALDPKIVLWVYATKHIRSVESFLKSGKTFSNETIEGRILDIIVYMMLLRGLLAEENQIKEMTEFSSTVENAFDAHNLRAYYNNGDPF